MINLANYLKDRQTFIEAELNKILPNESALSEQLFSAMRYSLLGGGKRFRPILVLATAEMLKGSIEDALPAALAIELIHTASLIHDDLPAMDNDTWRRDKLTNHKVYGEALAILAGDSLIIEAFRLLATSHLLPTKSARIIAVLANAAGPYGMMTGQAVDLTVEQTKLDLATLQFIHKHKTGCLIETAVECGAITADVDSDTLKVLQNYGYAIGLAFQIVDDILDFSIKKETASYPRLLGLEAAQTKAKQQVAIALQELNAFNQEAEVLRALANYIVELL